MPWPKGKPKPATRAKLTPEQVVEIRIRYADGKVTDDETEDYLKALDQLREMLRCGYELGYAK